MARLLLLSALAFALSACEKPDPGGPDDMSTSATEGNGSTGAPGIPCDLMSLRTSRTCEDTGIQYCHVDASGNYAWGTCTLVPVCTPGDLQGCGSVCELDADGVPFWHDHGCGSGSV